MNEDAKTAEKRRLAEALRANLRRRKAAAVERAARERSRDVRSADGGDNKD